MPHARQTRALEWELALELTGSQDTPQTLMPSLQRLLNSSPERKWNLDYDSTHQTYGQPLGLTEKWQQRLEEAGQAGPGLLLAHSPVFPLLLPGRGVHVLGGGRRDDTGFFDSKLIHLTGGRVTGREDRL